MDVYIRNHCLDDGSLVSRFNIFDLDYYDNESSMDRGSCSLDASYQKCPKSQPENAGDEELPLLQDALVARR